ncbi:DNA repair protein RadA [Gemmatimonadota bacterium]
MARKVRSAFRCAECGFEHPKWAGRCDSCGAWNTLVEELASAGHGKKPAGGNRVGEAEIVRLGELNPESAPRLETGLTEFDYVLGGGIVQGSVTIVGGEPGIGKSTLLLQCAARLEARQVPVLYVSGEESVEQTRIRADRLGEDAGAVRVLPEVRVESIIAKAELMGAKVVVVDSIQTTYSDELEGAPGNVGQVRECAAKLMRFAKWSGAAVFLVGHVTRGGVIAGPKTLEHVVDTVLYFEGETTNDFRILRAVKNRFGSVDEVGIFEMTANGLRPVANPSAAFLAGRNSETAGSAVTALLEGTRPVLVEIQALSARSVYGTPQRVATGLDHRRLAVLLAVLERRAGLPFYDLDVFVNVTGGVRLVEPASDLAVVAALWSSVQNEPLPADVVFLGEVGLGGEVRPVASVERRLAEAQRQGFVRGFVSARSTVASGFRSVPIGHVGDLARELAA